MIWCDSMKQNPKKIYKILIVSAVIVATLGMAFYISLIAVFHADLKDDFAAQTAWVNYLRYSLRESVDEQSFANFDLANNGLKLNEVQILATHNSFKAMPNPYLNSVLKLFNEGGVKKGEYGLPKLYEQLDSGIRGVELDVAMYGNQIVTVHNANNDWRTNTTDFRLALKEIKLWSDNNPGHYPLNVMVQVRNQFSFLSAKFNKFSSSSIRGLDAMMVEVFGNDLLPPATVKGDAATLHEAVTTTGWPEVSSCLGKVYVMMLFDEDVNRDDYVAIDPTFSTQNAFVMALAGYEEPHDYTAIILADSPYDDGYREYIEAGYILRTRVDLQYDHPEARLQATLQLGSQILATDYPVNNSYGDGYVCWAGEEGKTIVARG